MAKKDFVSKTDDGKVVQLVNFVNKIGLYKVLLGITDDQVTSITNDKNIFAFAVSLREAYKTKVQDVTKWKDILRDGPLGTPPGPIPPPVPAAGGLVPVNEGIFFRFRKLAAQRKSVV